MSETEREVQLSLWRGEFVDPANERAYRDRTSAASAADLRLALWTWVGLLLAFMGLDLQLYELRGVEWYLLATRLVLLIGLLILIWRLRGKPEIVMGGFVISLLEVLTFLSLILLYFIRPEALVYTVIVSILVLVAVFIAIPNRLVPALVSASFGISGTLFAAYLLSAGTETTLVIALALLTPAAIGYLAARKLHLTQRRLFAHLLLAEQSNRNLVKEIEHRKQAEEKLQLQAITDPLTGLFNRRHFEAQFRRERMRLMRGGGALTLCLVDLDHFKNINDTYGHEVGDKVLQAVSQVFLQQLRGTDIVGRIGGEEFVLLLPDTPVDNALKLIDRVRLAVEAELIKIRSGTVQVTATFGVTAVNAKEDNFANALRKADKALYIGKDAGRNQVVMAG